MMHDGKSDRLHTTYGKWEGLNAAPPTCLICNELPLFLFLLHLNMKKGSNVAQWCERLNFLSALTGP